VQHRNKTKLANEPPLWIAGEYQQSLFGSGKQHCQHNFLIIQNKRVEFMGQCKHIVKIRNMFS
jgi:hypothetical protein